LQDAAHPPEQRIRAAKRYFLAIIHVKVPARIVSQIVGCHRNTRN
jgi:hypothetical protein